MRNLSSRLTLKDFALLFGTEISDIPRECRSLISKTNFSYRRVTSEERDSIILEILKKIDSGDFSIAGKYKQKRWRKGWQEILNDFKKSGFNPENLKPHYDRKPGQFIRLNQDFISPENPMFEMEWLKIFRVWFFRKYLKDFDHIYEFGCGTGQNLVTIADLFPHKNLYGLEWVPAPIRIIKILAARKNLKIQGHLFDMFQPDYDINFQPKSVVLTRAALEQMSSNYDKFLNFILKKSPALCIHSEPIIELYDENNLIDYLAIKFQKKRNYLDGFLTRLRELEKEGIVEIIKVHRIPFGSLHLDPYSYIVWRPKKYEQNLNNRRRRLHRIRPNSRALKTRP